MPLAHVQSKSAHTDGTAATTLASGNFPAAVTAGNLIAVYASCGFTTGVTASFTDTLGNTYTAAGNPQVTDSSNMTFTAYAKNILGGTNAVTVTYSASVPWRAIIAHEISGADTASPLNGNTGRSQNAPGSATDAITSNAITTTSDGDYLFGAGTNDGGESESAGTNFTIRETNNDAGLQPFFSESLIQATQGSISATFTSPTGTNQFLTVVMAFKAPAAGGVVTPRLLALLGVGA